MTGIRGRAVIRLQRMVGVRAVVRMGLRLRLVMHADLGRDMLADRRAGHPDARSGRMQRQHEHQ